MFGLLIIIGIVIVCWFCIKWWAGVAVKGGSAVYNSLSGSNNSTTVSYYTNFQNSYCNTLKKVEEELLYVTFPVIASSNGGKIPTYTKTELPDGNYRFDITATNKAHSSIKFHCCTTQYSMFKV